MCSNCKVTYQGQTYRYFFTRAAEHMGVFNLTGKRSKISKTKLFQIIYYSRIAPLILIISIFLLLTSVNLFFSEGELTY